MPKPFLPLTVAQFRHMLARFPFARTITSVHMHHTFRPNHAQYRGLASIESMHRVHTEERGFSDIAQHVTIAPDGTIWTGRNWDKPPASASGNNGNPHAGPFMFEMIGDFDQGKDLFEDPQRSVALQVAAAVQQRFGLPPEALKFHNQMSPKSCPGSAIDFDEIVAALRELHRAPAERGRDLGEAPFAPTFRDDELSGVERLQAEAAIEALLKDTTPAEALPAAEPPEEDEPMFTGRGGVGSAAARGTGVGALDLVALRPHVINLEQGMLTQHGEYFTLPEDVERIFREDMERAFADPVSVGMPRRPDGEPFRVMIWAHGGLVNERDGLAIATKHLEFWKRNGIYPIHFVWETGLFETLGHMLRSIVPGAREARGFFSDRIGDPLIEGLARAIHAERIWSAMKRSAERAVLPQGGATKAARELKSFCNRHADAVEIHCAGHSAGAIFHAHFLPTALDMGIPPVAALYLLAPAVRVDTFKQRLLARVGNGIEQLGVFTMLRELELADNCAQLYRKSLLYLIRFSLEKDRNAEILGLEESMRRDRDVARLLGLGGAQSRTADVVFSRSIGTDGPFASQSTSHGGFDDDAPTMNSIALRILRLQTQAGLKMAYPATAARAAGDPWTSPEAQELERSFASALGLGVGFESSGFGEVPSGWFGAPAFGTPAPAGPAGMSAAGMGSVPVTTLPALPALPGGGRRLALCVGIDRYMTRPLAGCVADARLWERTLRTLGFRCETMLDGDATYANIKSGLERLIGSARPGDVIVWQYAGHGTQVPDVNGDEADGDSPGLDEAICPVDMHTGRMFTDDEIGALINQIQPGVSFTMLMDCCHSGTLNRFGMGEPPPPSGASDERPRFMPLTPELEQAYLDFARSPLAAVDKSRSRSRSALEQTNEVLFTACLSTEVAWESNGQGAFTVRATRLLGDRAAAYTNESFIQEVVAAFGPSRRQTPTIACAGALRGRQLFQPFGGAPVRGADVPEPTLGAAGRFGPLADAVEGVARQLRQL